jgi:hypothetical protein
VPLTSTVSGIGSDRVPTPRPARAHQPHGLARLVPHTHVSRTVTHRPMATTTPDASAPLPTPSPLPGLPDTGYGASAAAADTRGNGALLGAVLLGLLALAGGGVRSLWRRSGPR